MTGPDNSASGRLTPTGDPAVDALIDRARQAGNLPAGDHKSVYSSVIEGLEHELDADPAAALGALSSGTPQPGPTNGTEAP